MGQSVAKPKDYAKIAEKYATGVLSGKIDACDFVKQACQRHFDDLEVSKAKSARFEFDRAAANRFCRFMEHLPHIKGEWAKRGELLTLEPWQCFIFSMVFGWKRKKDGLRRFREAYIEVPRKNGKSCIGAGVGLYMFTADGEEGAEVFSGATTEKQAWEVFGPARLMASRADGLADHFGINVGAKNLSIEDHACKFEPVIGKPGDGASPHCALVDEYHEHATPDLYDTMITGQGARSQPLLLIITTAGTNIAAPCYDKRDQVKRVLAGKVKNDELFGIIYTIDADDDWTSIKAWRKANPNFGVSVNEDYLKARLLEAKQNASRQNIVKCKHLNVWSNARESWMNMHDWEVCGEEALNIDDFQGKKCIISFDMAETTDVMAIGITFFEEIDGKRHYASFSKFYLPEAQIEDPKNTHYMGWYKDGLLFSCGEKEIDNEQIQGELISLYKQFDVSEIVYDPWHAHDVVNYLEKSGLAPVQFLQRTQYLSPAMKEVTGAVSGGRFRHNKNKMMDWMVGNVVSKIDAKGEIFPRKEKSEFKIDGAVTLIMGVGRAMTAPDITPTPGIFDWNAYLEGRA